MASKKQFSLDDKLKQVSESFTVYMYDNGYMLEISGKNNDDDWKNAKVICNTLEELMALIGKIDKFPREE